MKKNLLSRREVMIICKSIFDFKAKGIKPLLKDIRLNDGWRFLSYYYYDDLDNEYYVKFFIKEARSVSFYVYKCVGNNDLEGIMCERFYIDLDTWSLYPFLKIHSDGSYRQSEFTEDDRIYLEG